SYGYDAAKRLTSVTSPAGSFSYSYDSTRNMQVKKLSLPNGAYITNTFDGVARLTGTYLKNSGNTSINVHEYSYNAGSQRTQQVFTAGNFVNYTYDSIGQLTTATGKEAGGVTNRLHEQFGYTYDAAGNLDFRTNNGFLQTFTVDTLNQLTNAPRTGNFTVAGTTTSAATNVTVNGSNSILYADNTFASTNHPLTVAPKTFTAIAKDNYGRTDTNSVRVFTPASPIFAYD